MTNIIQIYDKTIIIMSHVGSCGEAIEMKLKCGIEIQCSLLRIGLQDYDEHKILNNIEMNSPSTEKKCFIFLRMLHKNSNPSK